MFSLTNRAFEPPQVQSATKAKVNIAQSGDHFPGTVERAVLVTGSMAHVLACQGMIWNRIAPSIQAAPEDEAAAVTDSASLVVTGKLV